MEEFDSHSEHAQEQAHEAAHESRERWITGVALTAALLAALAAVTSMLSGHHEHESMIQQLEANDKWAYYQAKGVKTILREAQLEDRNDSGSPAYKALQDKIKDSKKKQADTRKEAEEMQEESKFHDHLHMMLAGGVTLFQVAIAVSAIAALTRRRAYWIVGIGLGTVAAGFLAAALLVWSGAVHLHKPPHEQAAGEVHEPAAHGGTHDKGE
jgi:hypothetical protein